MLLTSPSQVRNLLNELGISPNKTLGQNFLIDANILRILVDAADLGIDDHILEIGPGLGVVTQELLRRSGRVTAVEKDRKLAAFLQEQYKDEPRLDVIHADMLDLDLEELSGRGITRVVSNLPYSSGSRILVALAQAPVPPDRILVTVQREVAERLAAGPDSRSYGLLSVWIQLVYEVSLVRNINPTCFWPRPEVKSGIVSLVKRRESLPEERVRAFFYRLTRLAFGHRRKQLAGILEHESSGLGLASGVAAKCLFDLGLDEKVRPENLSVADWLRLSDVLLPVSQS